MQKWISGACLKPAQRARVNRFSLCSGKRKHTKSPSDSPNGAWGFGRKCLSLSTAFKCRDTVSTPLSYLKQLLWFTLPLSCAWAAETWAACTTEMWAVLCCALCIHSNVMHIRQEGSRKGGRGNPKMRWGLCDEARYAFRNPPHAHVRHKPDKYCHHPHVPDIFCGSQFSPAHMQVQRRLHQMSGREDPS